MHAASDTVDWRGFFEGLRPEDVRSVVLYCQGGLQIALQDIARIEDGLLMVRGRVAGNADSGRLFLMPYGKIDTIMVNRKTILEEAELFSPTASAERKEEIAQYVIDLEESARREAEQQDPTKAAASSPSTSGNSGGISPDVRMQLEALRNAAERGTHSGPTAAPPPAKSDAAPGTNAPSRSGPTITPPPRPASTGRSSLPTARGDGSTGRTALPPRLQRSRPNNEDGGPNPPNPPEKGQSG